MGFLRKVLPQQPEPHHRFLRLGQICQGKANVQPSFHRLNRTFTVFLCVERTS